MIDRSGRFLYSNQPLRSTDLDYTCGKISKQRLFQSTAGAYIRVLKKYSKAENGFIRTGLADRRRANPLVYDPCRAGNGAEQGHRRASNDPRHYPAQKNRAETNRWNEELEARVDERTRQLKESNERLRAISELIPDYVYLGAHRKRWRAFDRMDQRRVRTDHRFIPWQPCNRPAAGAA
jgi:hypothetical protein